ncbi:hypothetical protein NLI96_g3697 [Meripilus lineatus]|uniref:Uncharacterized protein n=1 Tax=Meripilus lineatus TaxID=2056292 RepID=A0AAD5V6I7_9APHY|nr:hypothetical protein NLI96_g3697 [Physisporinus lineatus]
MAQAAARTVNDMPPRGSKHAPKTFKGQAIYLQEFLNDLEALFQYNNVGTDDDKVKMLARYCNHSVKELLETLNDYIAPNFDQLKAELKKIYDYQKVELRYNKKNLKEFCKTSCHEPFRTLGTVRSHYRNFQKIAGWLKKNQQITEARYNKAFWESILRDFRPKVEGLILRRIPTHDLSTSFSVSQITTALENLFRRDRFDNDISDSDSESDSDQSSATDSKEEEAEYSRFSKGKGIPKKSKTLIKAKSKKRSKPSRVIKGAEAKKALDKLEAEASIAENQDEIEILIKRLQNMSFDDPKYVLQGIQAG